MNIITPVNLTSANYTINRNPRRQMNTARNEDQTQLSFGSGKQVSKEVVNNKKLAGVLPGILVATFCKLTGRKETDFSDEFDQVGNYDGKLVRAIFSQDNKNLESINIYDPETGKLVKKTYIVRDCKRVDEYDPKTEKRIKQTCFQKDGEKIDCIVEYDPVTGKDIKLTGFWNDGETIRQVREYDLTTGKEIKETIFREDGITIQCIYERNPETGKRTKYTYVRTDGVKNISEYDPETERLIKETKFRADGKKYSINEYDPETGEFKKRTQFREYDETIEYIAEYAPETGIRTATYYHTDGITKWYISEYDTKAGNKTKETYFRTDGETIHSIYEYNPKSGKLVKRNIFQNRRRNNIQYL